MDAPFAGHGGTRSVAIEIGQIMEVTYTVANFGGSTPPTQSRWDDLIYFSRDEFLDIRADRYLPTIPGATSTRHEGGLGADGDDYQVTTRVRVPLDLLDETEQTKSYYLFVVTNPVRSGLHGEVVEPGAEMNNARAADPPVIIERPPAADIDISEIVIPDAVKAGDPITISWKGRNISDVPINGSWSDSVYLSADALWDIGDVPIGRSPFTGTLAPSQESMSSNCRQ